MVWQKVPGVVGRVYRPDAPASKKKHPCKDCYCCQGCSEQRCQVCIEDRQNGRRTHECCTRTDPSATGP